MPLPSNTNFVPQFLRLWQALYARLNPRPTPNLQPPLHPMASDTHGIARIVKPGPDGKGEGHVGMAIVVDPWHLITCCHVVNLALGREEMLDPRSPPTDAQYSVRF